MSENRHVKNPKTSAQTLQRVLVKVVALAYAMLKAICNHSFEGVTNGFQCMNKFKKVNLRYLRERAATLQSLGQSLNQFYQFMPLQGEKWSPFAAIISQGHLPEVSVGIDAEGGHKAYVNTPSRTYADFVNSWGLQRGDQVTFVTVQKRQGKYEVNYARLILNPRNADGSGAPMTTEIVDSQGEFPCSNWKNQLNFSTFEFDTDYFNFVLGRGGVTPGQPSYSTTATINGVSQSISGGTVTATAPVTSVAVCGNNLGEVVFTAKVDGTGDAINPTSHDANGASFTGLNVAAGHSFIVYRGGNLWFTITAQDSGDELEG